MQFKTLINHLGFKTRLLQYTFFISFIYAIFFIPSNWFILSLICYAITVSLGGNIGLHRYYGHKSFQTDKFWHNVLTFFAHYIGVGSVISWVGQHRYHHLYADTDKDIHSPHTNKILKVIFGLWNVKISKKLILDVINNKNLQKYHQFYFKMHFFIIIFLIVIDINFDTFFYFTIYAIPNFLCLMSGYTLAFITHYHGYQTFNTTDKSTNSWIANIITLGEGWHNNHHYNSKLKNTKIKWWEFDLQYQIIKFIELKNDNKTSID